jgi:hypothetical protein
LLLALLLPLAQAVAASHAITHHGTPAQQRDAAPSALDATCVQCLLAAPVGAGALPSTPLALAVPGGAHAAPPAPAFFEPASDLALAYRRPRTACFLALTVVCCTPPARRERRAIASNVDCQGAWPCAICFQRASCSRSDFSPRPWRAADDLAALRAEMQALRANYEARMQALEARLQAAERVTAAPTATAQATPVPTAPAATPARSGARHRQRHRAAPWPMPTPSIPRCR